jgi:hypothetical protein
VGGSCFQSVVILTSSGTRMSSLPISPSAMTRYASGMSLALVMCLSCVRANALYSIHKWAAADPQMKKYLSTSGDGYSLVGMGTGRPYGGLPQSMHPTAGLNLLDEYDRGITTIQKWQKHA